MEEVRRLLADDGAILYVPVAQVKGRGWEERTPERSSVDGIT